MLLFVVPERLNFHYNLLLFMSNLIKLKKEKVKSKIGTKGEVLFDDLFIIYFMISYLDNLPHHMHRFAQSWNR